MEIIDGIGGIFEARDQRAVDEVTVALLQEEGEEVEESSHLMELGACQ